MTDLVPCPLCGGSEGYSLQKQPYDYKRLDVYCADCGEQVTECRAGENRFKDTPPEGRTPEADAAWNAAGAYAEGLRQELAHARADIERLSVDLAEASRTFACTTCAARQGQTFRWNALWSFLGTLTRASRRDTTGLRRGSCSRSGRDRPDER